ncbi:MAG TPA: hypothetical protein PKM08_00385 [Syntrophorhabdaceae bacterium]|nr:hypothetical protein [Syntrophorhabdaceae bacterium]HNT68243.1 hypothetical protein [Syntrophorhabdaceae bacterium]
MNIFQRVIVEPFEKCYEKLLYFLPNFFTSILLLIAGILLAVIIRVIFQKLFKTIKLDRFSERSGIVEALSKSGIREPLSVLISKIIEWIIILTFLVVAMQNLRIPTVEHLLERFFLYVPNMFIAAFILIIGYLLSNFFRRAVLIASVNAGIKYSGLLSKFVKFTVFILSCTMALEQLGIGKDTVIIAFAVTFGGVILALAIACGLGGKDIAREYLEKKMKEDNKGDGINHL